MSYAFITTKPRDQQTVRTKRDTKCILDRLTLSQQLGGVARPVDVPLPDELQHGLGRLHPDSLVAQLGQLLVELPRVVVQGGGQLGRHPEEGHA